MTWFKFLENTSNLASPPQEVYITPPLKRRNSI